MLIPVIIKVIENKYATNPIDCKNKSDTKLPWKPNVLLILVLSGKIKLGSSGEYVDRDIKSIIPAKKMIIPKISANLLMVKLSNRYAVFFMFI